MATGFTWVQDPKIADVAHQECNVQVLYIIKLISSPENAWIQIVMTKGFYQNHQDGSNAHLGRWHVKSGTVRLDAAWVDWKLE